MRLGIFTNYSEKIACEAHEVGFRSMELSAWPGSALNANTITDEDIKKIRKDLDSRDIEISALGYYPNYLDPDPDKRAESQRYLLKLLALAQSMEVPTVCTFAGRDPEKSVADNIPLFKEVFSRFCEEAERRQVRIALENCPMMDRFTMKGTNIAFSPEIWDVMFSEVSSDYLGIELDPAHMVFMGIDYIQAVYEYGEKIFHVHAKDMEIRQDVLQRVGIYGMCFSDVPTLSHGWWYPRLPGWGEIQWTEFISALIEVGYDSNLDIEFEDTVLTSTGVFGEWVVDSGVIEKYGDNNEILDLAYKSLARYLP